MNKQVRTNNVFFKLSAKGETGDYSLTSLINPVHRKTIQLHFAKILLQDRQYKYSWVYLSGGKLIIVVWVQFAWSEAATSWKVAGSIPDEVIAFLNKPNPSSRTMALGSTQFLTEMSTRNLPGGKGVSDA
jgi:hypothetical protein